MDNMNYFGIPAGFGIALSLNERALNGYSQMTEAEKEKIILQCKDARSDKEVEEIIDSIAGDGIAEDLDLDVLG